MIEVDYGPYLKTQAEWADSLMRAAARDDGIEPSYRRDLTLAAGDALGRLSAPARLPASRAR
jgi:hypothetical protein